LPKVKEADEIAGGYFGGTHYTYVQLKKPIEIKGKYVYIHSANGKYDMTFEKRYNVNKLGDEIDGRKSLNYDLSNILKAFKSVLKDNYAKGGAVKDKIKVRGFAPITKEEAMLLNEDFEENFNSNIERFTKHLNKVHNSKLRVIDTQSVIDFANQKPTTEELNNMTAFNLMEAMKYDKKSYESYKKALLKLYPDAKGFAEGGGVDNPSRQQMLDYLNMYFDYYSELRTIAIEEDNILTRRMLKSLDDEELEIAYEDAQYEIKADTQYADGGEVDEVISINIQGYPYYLKKMGDTTHFKMANSKDGIDMVIGSHIAQHKGEEYYSDVASWLKGGKSPNGKSYSSYYYAEGGGISGLDDLIRG